MGCNTSKESVQPVGDEAKEDEKNGDIPKAESSPTEVESQEASQKKSQDAGSKSSSASGKQQEAKDEGKDAEKEREEAATRIQAAFRGHHARKSMKETESSTKQAGTKSNSDPTKEQLQQEFRADDKELCEAATKIQASFRGHMSRKEQATALVKSAENAMEDLENKAKDAMNEIQGIDLTDPDLHKAATKIQASFRGHKVRQEVLSNPAPNDEPKK